MNKEIIIIGGGNHSNSIVDIISRLKKPPKILGYTDKKKTMSNLNYLGKDKIIYNYNNKNVLLVNGIGLDIKLRESIFKKFSLLFEFYKIIDDSAVVSKNANIEAGVIIFPLTHVGPNVTIEKNVVIHTKTSIEHDSKINQHSYLGPNCTICGNVDVGKSVLIGGASFLKQGIKIENRIKISAGSTVLKSFNKQNTLVYGSPAKEKK